MTGWDYLSAEEIRNRQFEALSGTLAHAFGKSPFYRALYASAGIGDVRDVRGWEDFARLPVVDKEQIRRANWEVPALPREHWVDVARTTGTTGAGIYLPASKRDFGRYAEITAALHTLAGIRAGDVVQITYSMGEGLWIAGLHNWLGLHRLGICALRSGPGYSQGQLELMSAMGTSVLLGAPAFMLRLGQEREKLGAGGEIVRLICMSGENIVGEDFSLNAYGRKIAGVWPRARLKPVYGASEGPVCGSVCDGGAGYHIPSEFFYLEILDRETHAALPPGETGVLAVSALGGEAFPLIRYVLGDVTRILPGVCACGWAAPRLGPIRGRVDSLLKVKGILVSPEAVGSFVAGLPETAGYYVTAFRDGFADGVRVSVALAPQAAARGAQEALACVERALKNEFRLHFEVVAEPAETVMKKTTLAPDGKPRTKPKRFFDERTVKE